MAQLIKLQDYVSRYEIDIFKYPIQFVRLKKQHWTNVFDLWKNGYLHEPVESCEWEEQENDEKKTWKNRLFHLFKREKVEEERDHAVDMRREEEFAFDSSRAEAITSEQELKQHFLDQLFHFQLKWASSTFSEKSYVDLSYYSDETLRFLLQRFPDTVLLMYHPVFKLKKAPVDLEVLLITPTHLWCITFLEEENEATFVGSKDRFWEKKWTDTEKKVLNPLISLKRMEHIVTSIFKKASVELPIQKAVICRNGYIDYPTAPYDVKLIDKRVFDEWFQHMRTVRSPLKHMQLKGAKSLLDYCHTTSFKRNSAVLDMDIEEHWDEEELEQ
jgi:hypothetical protein